MRDKKEQIKLIVTYKIEYTSYKKDSRKEAIQNAKLITLGNSSGGGYSYAEAVKAKLIK